MTPATPIAERAPSRVLIKFNCPHCGTFASHEWQELGYRRVYEYDETEFVLSEQNVFMESLPRAWDFGGGQAQSEGAITHNVFEDQWVAKSTWAQSECNGCSEIATWRMDAIVFPTSSPAPFPHDDMPEPVVALYNEARSVVTLSRRAAAALARATMERLLRELSPDAPKGARLDDLILHVEDKVSSGLAALLTFIRHVGNQALHVTGVPDDAVVLVLESDSSEPVEAIFEAINQLVDELITKPARNHRLAAFVPPGVVESIERKRRAQGARNAASQSDSPATDSSGQ